MISIALLPALLAASVLAQAENPPLLNFPIHEIHVQERLLTPEDGLLLGNGDLSVSVYQSADRIIWRFGKSDVWDRRLDLSDDPKPAHIDEIANGIEKEGWKCPPYGGPVEATKGTDNPARMKELCQGASPSYVKRPYPCPKPVGELAMQLPADQTGLKIDQVLSIENATLTINCTWDSGAALEVRCFVPPKPNVLLVSYHMNNWDVNTRTGNALPPFWFSLYRWADPSIQEFAAKFYGDYRHDGFKTCASPKATPLPPPTVQNVDGLPVIEQTFPPDPTFPDGFRYLLAPLCGPTPRPADMSPTGEARLHMIPQKNAHELVVVAVTTTSDPGGPNAELARIAASLKEPDTFSSWMKDNHAAAEAFWAKSRVSLNGDLLEHVWYETLHARRCTTREGIAPPGLFLPSTVQDYSHWHGDYHTNYNLQEPYWGDYTANHFEVGDAYFKAIDYFLPIGRKIARDYYNCRGAFIQLSGYPITAEDDVLGCVPMGRMAYMTGWAINQYWWRYRYTMDADWLRKTGYPVIREAALFYTDFAKKRDDGLYHVFPSNQGEDGFTGNPKDYTDRAQIMQHMRYCLRVAIESSRILGIDDDLRAQWTDRLEHCAGDDGQPPLALTGIEKTCRDLNPPEFGVGRPFRPQPETAEGAAWPPPEDAAFTWYFGQYPWGVMQRLRGGEFIAVRDMPAFRRVIQRWRHPNGLLWAMSVANYGHAGAWTESLGVIAPLQEMMLQSWDGALRIFPAWPKDLPARFENFRAEGAFLVSAATWGGTLRELHILSEKGAPCRIYFPWPNTPKITDPAGANVTSKQTDGILEFETTPGGVYTLTAGM